MSRKLAMCLVWVALSSGVGCKGNPANRGADPAGAGAMPSPRAALVTAARGHVTLRDDGSFAASSPDGTQVMLLKEAVIDGEEIGWYQMCDATGTTLQCGEWVRMDASTPCTLCFAEPCPCTNPACASLCKPK